MSLALAAAQPACASSKHTAAAARQQAACLAAPRLSSGARRAFVAGSSSRAVQRSSSVVVKVSARRWLGWRAAWQPAPCCWPLTPASPARLRTPQAAAAEAATGLRK